MKLQLAVALADNGRYIAVALAGEVGQFTLRRFPWPSNATGRRHQQSDACAYAAGVGAVLGVKPEVDTAIEAGVLLADAGLIIPNHDERRRVSRPITHDRRDDNNPDI